MYIFLDIAVSTTPLITANNPSPVVPSTLLREVFLWLVQQSLSWDDVISRLRSRTVPAGYPYHAWKRGDQMILWTLCLLFYVGQSVETEERVDKLRSILSQLEFSHRVCEYDQKGTPFRVHLHCPEVHPDTGHAWYEREDPAHVLKVSSHYFLKRMLT